MTDGTDSAPEHNPAQHALKRVLVQRLTRYYDFVKARVADSVTVSSAEIADFLSADATQVRKDLSVIGVRGCPRVGYITRDVLEKTGHVLGIDVPHRAIVVGAGNLGRAIVLYPGLLEIGLEVVGVFDNDPVKTGARIGSLRVRVPEEIEPVVRENGVCLGILSLPAASAQEVADRLVSLNVRALWNFAPTTLSAPASVVVRYENIANGLAELFHYMSRLENDTD
jgi:redox-sensing transcriptional repressor